jgi:hypothetical protein
MEDTTILTIVFCSFFGLFGLTFVTYNLTENLIKYHWFPRIFEKKGKLWYDYPYWIWVLVPLLYGPLFPLIAWFWGAYTVLRVSWKILGVIPKIIYIGWAYKDGDAESQFKKVWPQFARVQKYSKDRPTLEDKNNA